MEPSPTAEATRLTLPDRASPTANTAGLLVSNMYGGRDKGQFSVTSRSRPVRTKPLSSSKMHPDSQAVLGDAPAITKTWRMGCLKISPLVLSIHETCAR